MSETAAAIVEFDANDPALLAYVPAEVDPNANIKQTIPQPISDGEHTVVLRLNDRRQGGPVYIKGEKDLAGNVIDAKLVAAFRVRAVNEDGTEGQYLKDWWATSIVMNGQTASSVSAVCYQAGKPFPSGNLSLPAQKAHLERLFAEAGDEGIRVVAKTRWVKSHQEVDASGMPVFNADNSKKYVEVKGEMKIKAAATKDALAEVATWQPRDGQTPEDFAKEKADWVADAPNRCHVFTDPVAGGELRVQAEIDRLAD